MISLLEETREFRDVAEVLYVKGWAEASAGNMSLRLAALPQSIAKLAPDPQRIHDDRSGHDRPDRRFFPGYSQRQPHA